MTAGSSRFRRVLPPLLVAAGVVVVLFAVLADTLGLGGSSGFGLRQWLLLGSGAVLLLAGAWLRPGGPAWLRVRAQALLRDAPLLTPAQVLLLAVLFGLGTGLLENVVLFGERFLAGRMLRMGDELLWVLPLSNTLVMVAAGLVLLLAGLLVRQLRATAFVALVYTFFSVDAVLARWTWGQRIDNTSRFVLILGIGVALTRWLVERRHAGTRPMRRLALGLAGVLALVAVSIPVARAVRERVLLARLPDARADAPNILFVIWDTVRAKSLSLYGYERPTTPNLERLASTGTTFDFALSTASWTLPSHASMFTGRYPNALNATWRVPLDDAQPTVTEVLAEHGWATAGFSANLAYATRESGIGRGFAHYEDFFVTPRRMAYLSHMVQRNLIRLGLLSDRGAAILGLKDGIRINDGILAWLDGQPAERPWFVFANYMDAHDPYHVGAPWDTLYGGEAADLLQTSWTGFYESDPARIAAGRDAYDRCITYLDALLGSLIDDLRERGRLENTIIVVAADHGEHFGENGFMRHGTTLYLPALHVPLVVIDPARVPGGVRIAEEATIRDVPATMLDLAGVRDARIHGRSLRRYWTGEDVESAMLYAETRQGVRLRPGLPNAEGDLHALVSNGFHLIRRTDTGAEELYNYVLDPAEEVNLVESGTADSVLAVLRAALDGYVATEVAAHSDETRIVRGSAHR